MGICTSKRCLPRSCDGRPAGCRESRGRPARGRLQRACGLRLGRHPAAERLAAGKDCHVRQPVAGLGHGGADGGLGQAGRIGPLAAPFHVGKLIAQGGDAALAQFHGDGGQERVIHSRTRPMRQHEAGPRLRRHQQQAGDANRIVDLDVERFCHGRGHARLPSLSRQSATSSIGWWAVRIEPPTLSLQATEHTIKTVRN